MTCFQTEVLKGVRKNPQFYFPPPCFRSLQSYVRGVVDTLLECKVENELLAEFRGFDEWLEKRLGRSLFSGWMAAIAQMEQGDKKRVILFAELFLEFREERQRARTDAAPADDEQPA